jgi:hypothetical protein
MSYDALLINTTRTRAAILDKYGDFVSWAITSNVKCRIMFINKIIRTLKGEEVTSFAKVFFLKTKTIDDTMEIEITDGNWRPMIKTDTPQDSVQVHHKEVWVS